MRKTLLLAALALPMAMIAREPSLVNPPAPLPDAVKAVSPEQGFIDTSGDVSPLGAGEISFVFAGAAEVVANTSVTSELYRDGKLLATSGKAYVDAMGNRIASINFGRQVKVGWYEVKMTEGQFTIGGQPSPAMSLFYQIEGFCNILTTPGIIYQIDDVILGFDKNVFKVELDSEKLAELACLAHIRNDDGADVTPEFEMVAEAFEEGGEWGVAIRFGQIGGIGGMALMNEGNYEVNIPAGLIKSYSYGPDYATDPTDVIERTNPRYNLTYIIPSFPEPDCEPATYSVVECFDKFVLTMPSGLTILFADNMASSIIYPVVDGVVDMDTPLYKVKATGWDITANTVSYQVIDPATNTFAKTPIVPEPGDYALVLSDKAFSGTWKPYENIEARQVFAAPYQFFFTVSGESAVENVEAVADDFTVYNLQGVRVAKGISAAQVNALPAGLYIVNGKKVMVK